MNEEWTSDFKCVRKKSITVKYIKKNSKECVKSEIFRDLVIMAWTRLSVNTSGQNDFENHIARTLVLTNGFETVTA